MGRDKMMIIFCIVMASLAMASMATIEEDEQECAEQLTNLASCIPFVSGTAKKPTSECCQDTQKLKASKPKCLCVLIKESTDPSMGLPINTTLALQMPAACNIDASVSSCPKLLNLAPDSPDAKIFKEAGGDSSTASTTTPSSSSSSPDSSSKSDTTNDKATTSSSNGAKTVSFGTAGLLMMIASYALVIFM
ncbi:hypothetical protein AB3S75_016768 [Citrus x aurantiifolia]